MAQFPRASSQRQLTTRQPEVMRNEAAAKTKIASDAIATVQDATIKWDNALTTSQLNAFKATKGVFLADVKSRAMLDPDQNNAVKYNKEIEDYSKNAFKGMSERAKREAALELNTDVALAKIQVDGIFQKKIIDQSKLSLAISLEGYKDSILSAGTGPLQQRNFFEAYAQIQRNVEDDIISPDDGKRLKEKFDEDVRVGLIDNALYSDPESFKKNAADYEYKDAKEKSDKLAKADALIKAEKKKLEWQETQINTVGCYDLSNALLAGTLTHDAVVDMHNKGQIDAETAAIFDEVIVTGEYEIADGTKKGLPEFYIRLLDESLDDKTESLEIMKNAAKSYGQGGMGKNQYAHFINEAKVRFDKQKKGESWGNKVLKGAVDGIKQWAKDKKDTVVNTANYLRDLIDRTQAGKDPNAAADAIIREERINQYPWIKNLPSEGERRMCPDGVVRKFYPDGRIEDSK